MKKLTHRVLPALLALVLALSLAVPALAVEPVRVTGISLNRSQAVMTPRETLVLTAAVGPANASVPDVLWESSRAAASAVSQDLLIPFFAVPCDTFISFRSASSPYGRPGWR